ncbi:hypothetical protein SAMN05660772_00903 [Pasteurella testudinis DSM 23072]|uniref:Lipoprotein n=1 Tax=Pasteurella testudinis DSM 23072 TaxID=1122938 RepID=A0A1W1V0N7_9PAST|nr:hypothetical protein [Pasteurella testudinis]SMB86574.1 hypothetical protein SAMN05660772_00903 [Pasteurella testudinis DSM 23072]SUB51822.1 Uncharacterised protein [Pasteurella testudinis]
MLKITTLLLIGAVAGLSACSSKAPMQTGSIYPNPHLTPPTKPIPSPPEQDVRNASDQRQKADYNRQTIYVRPAVSVGYGYHRGWNSHRHHHVGAGFYPYYW